MFVAYSYKNQSICVYQDILIHDMQETTNFIGIDCIQYIIHLCVNMKLTTHIWTLEPFFITMFTRHSLNTSIASRMIESWLNSQLNPKPCQCKTFRFSTRYKPPCKAWRKWNYLELHKRALLRCTLPNFCLLFYVSGYNYYRLISRFLK